MMLERLKIRLVGLDWSGVGSDDRKLVLETDSWMCENLYGLEPIRDFRTLFTDPAGNAVDHFLGRGVQDDPQKIAADYELALNMMVNQGFRPSMYDGLPETLRELVTKGFRIAVVSSHPTPNLLAEAEEYGVLDYFDAMVGDCRNKSAAIVDLMARFGVKRRETVFGGDMVSDILAGHRAGVRPIGFLSGYHTEEMLREFKPWRVLPDVTHLPRAILAG